MSIRRDFPQPSLELEALPHCQHCREVATRNHLDWRATRVSARMQRMPCTEMGQTVLDVGCGLGGPCRMLADEYNCQVTGLDLSNEYIRTAKELSKLVKLDSKTSFIQGDVILTGTSIPKNFLLMADQITELRS